MEIYKVIKTCRKDGLCYSKDDTLLITKIDKEYEIIIIPADYLGETNGYRFKITAETYDIIMKISEEFPIH